MQIINVINVNVNVKKVKKYIITPIVCKISIIVTEKLLNTACLSNAMFIGNSILCNVILLNDYMLHEMYNLLLVLIIYFFVCSIYVGIICSMCPLHVLLECYTMVILVYILIFNMCGYMILYYTVFSTILNTEQQMEISY